MKNILCEHWKLSKKSHSRARIESKLNLSEIFLFVIEITNTIRSNIETPDCLYYEYRDTAEH